MIITVERKLSSAEATISIVSVDDNKVCYGLEDEHRQEKLVGETRVPAGTYKIELRTVGGFHSKYSKRFPSMHRGMLWVKDVPSFEYILIHIGNDDDDTAGCLLVGNVPIMTQSLNLKVALSSNAYQKLYQKVIDAAINDDLQIKYIDSDIA